MFTPAWPLTIPPHPIMTHPTPPWLIWLHHDQSHHEFFIGPRFILRDHWLPLFWTLCDPLHGFRRQDGSFACTLTCFHAVDLRVTSGATPFSTNRSVNCKVCTQQACPLDIPHASSSDLHCLPSTACMRNVQKQRLGSSDLRPPSQQMSMPCSDNSHTFFGYLLCELSGFHCTLVQYKTCSYFRSVWYSFVSIFTGESTKLFSINRAISTEAGWPRRICSPCTVHCRKSVFKWRGYSIRRWSTNATLVESDATQDINYKPCQCVMLPFMAQIISVVQYLSETLWIN